MNIVFSIFKFVGFILKSLLIVFIYFFRSLDRFIANFHKVAVKYHELSDLSKDKERNEHEILLKEKEIRDLSEQIEISTMRNRKNLENAIFTEEQKKILKNMVVAVCDLLEKDPLKSYDDALSTARRIKPDSRDNFADMGNAFEIYCARYYELKNKFVFYNGLIKGKSDSGVDLVVIDDNATIYVQCKNWWKRELAIDDLRLIRKKMNGFKLQYSADEINLAAYLSNIKEYNDLNKVMQAYRETTKKPAVHVLLVSNKDCLINEVLHGLDAYNSINFGNEYLYVYVLQLDKSITDRNNIIDFDFFPKNDGITLSHRSSKAQKPMPSERGSPRDKINKSGEPTVDRMAPDRLINYRNEQLLTYLRSMGYPGVANQYEAWAVYVTLRDFDLLTPKQKADIDAILFGNTP